MKPERYSLIFSGKVLVGRDPSAVRGRLGAAFQLSDAQLTQLFSGNPIPIKHDVDSQTAAQYRAAFHKAGAVLELQKTVQPQPARAVPPGGPPGATLSCASKGPGRDTGTSRTDRSRRERRKSMPPWFSTSPQPAPRSRSAPAESRTEDVARFTGRSSSSLHSSKAGLRTWIWESLVGS